MILLSFTHPNIDVRVTALDALGDEATERDRVILRLIEQQQKKSNFIQLSCEVSKTPEVKVSCKGAAHSSKSDMSGVLMRYHSPTSAQQPEHYGSPFK